MRFSSPLAVVALASTVDAFAWPQGWSAGSWSGGKTSGTSGGKSAPQAESHAATDAKAAGPEGGFIGQAGGATGFTGAPAGFTGVPKSGSGVPKGGSGGAQFPTFTGSFHPPAATGAPAAPADAPAGPAHAPSVPAAAAPAAASGAPTGGAHFGGFNGGMGGGMTGSTCPPVWDTISDALATMFAGCNDDARAAIRAGFHDCFVGPGGCDGSLRFELSRPENTPMTNTVQRLANLAEENTVSVADMISFAASKAVLICPGGPRVPTMVGRVDATVAGPENKLPAPNATADDSIKLFSAQGFTVDDLTALLGAHTTSKQFATVPAKAGAPQDTTPAEWDILYYSQTIAGTAPVTFIADANLVADPRSAPSFKQFASDKPGWDEAFASAMARLERLGNGKGANIDCTAALGAMPTKRDLGSAPLFGAMLHKHKRSASGSGGHYHSWH